MAFVYMGIGIVAGVAGITFLDLWLWSQDRRDRRGK